MGFLVWAAILAAFAVDSTRRILQDIISGVGVDPLISVVPMTLPAFTVLAFGAYIDTRLEKYTALDDRKDTETENDNQETTI